MDLVDAYDPCGPEDIRAQSDGIVYAWAMAFLANVVGRAMGRVVERSGGISADDTRQWSRESVNQALAKLLVDLAPALGSFPALPVAHDLRSAIEGDSPIALVAPVRRRGQKDRESLWRTARRQVVLAMYFEAGRKDIDMETARRKLAPEIGDDQWAKMKGLISKERRQSVREAGKRGDTSQSDAALAARALAEKWDDLVAFALTRNTGSNRDLTP
jgi:hypothetical protein